MSTLSRTSKFKSAALSRLHKIPKWIFISLLLLIILILIVLLIRDNTTSSETDSPALIIIEEVKKGDVSAGITASGTIIAREKLNLNIYRQQHRIDSAGISNGAQVKKGQLLFSFDDDDISLKRQESELSRSEAQLGLQEIEETFTDPSSTIRTLKNDIAILEKDILAIREDKLALLHEYYSADLEARPVNDPLLISKNAPAISGKYTSSLPGTYVIEFYKSASDSGFAFTVSGLERASNPVHYNKIVPLGTRGLRISVPADISGGDKWEVVVPNTFSPNYAVNSKKYRDGISSLDTNYTTKTTSLANKLKELADQNRKDTTTYKSIDKSKIELQLRQAQLDIQNTITQQYERHIRAPFSGTVEGVENIVAGATPTGQDNDSMNFGTLISNEFEVMFSLDALQVSKISVGQEVVVTISTGLPIAPLTAKVTAISSLPESSSVPKYSVQALLAYAPGKSEVVLREGMLTDVQIIEEKKTNVVRVPITALEFKGREATLQVVPTLGEQQETAMSAGSVVSTQSQSIQTVRTKVELGLIGDFYAEIMSGVEVGDKIAVTSTQTATEAQVNARLMPSTGGGFSRRSQSSGALPRGNQ